MSSSLNNVIPHIIDQHGEDAAFLWLLRDAAVLAPHYSLPDLADLDERVEAHLDGLRIAGSYGWEVCLKNLKYQEPGEVFAATVVALTGDSSNRIKDVYDVVGSHRELVRPLISGLGWVPSDKLRGVVKGLLESSDPFWVAVGIAACSAHRVDPGHYLDMAIKQDDPFLIITAVKTAAKLGRVDVKKCIDSHISSDQKKIAFWASWATVLLGDRAKGLSELQCFCSQYNSEKALQLVLRVQGASEQNTFLKRLASDDNTLRFALIGAGISGDPVYIPWLIKHFDEPALARVAGEAFSLITGVDLAYDDLETDWPEGFQAGPNDDVSDDNTELDQDEDLAWPDHRLLAQWWEDKGSKFSRGQRYLMGDVVSEHHCKEVLKTGKQRQRKAAAMELALMRPDMKIMEIRANGKKQQQVLSSA